MSISHLTRCATSLLAVAFLYVACCPGTVRATEIEPPAPLTEDLGDLDARATLARWLGGDAPDSPDTLVTASRASSTPGDDRLIVGVDGAPALRVTSDPRSTLPPLAMAGPKPERGGGGGFEVLRLEDRDASWMPSRPVPSPADAAGGGTRFDSHPEDRNPVELRSSVLDEITARVVRTPEPGTLALFALGLAGLAAAVAARRRHLS